MKYYFSLVGPLLGIYYPLPDDLESEAERRMAVQTSRLKNLWMSIYTEVEVDEQIAEFGGIKLPNSFARKLDYDSHQVSQVKPGTPPLRGHPGGL